MLRTCTAAFGGPYLAARRTAVHRNHAAGLPSATVPDFRQQHPFPIGGRDRAVCPAAFSRGQVNLHARRRRSPRPLRCPFRMLVITFENSTCRGPLQARSEALRSHCCGSPPCTGNNPGIPVDPRAHHAICDARAVRRKGRTHFGEAVVGELYRLAIRQLFDVNLAGETANQVVELRTKASIRPSGESAGWLTGSGSLVS